MFPAKNATVVIRSKDQGTIHLLEQLEKIIRKTRRSQFHFQNETCRLRVMDALGTCRFTIRRASWRLGSRKLDSSFCEKWEDN